MLRTAQLAEAMRAHGKTLAVSAVVVGALAAGGASAALTSGAAPASSHLAAAPVTHHAAVPTAGLTLSTNQSKRQSAAATPTMAFPIGHATPTMKTAKAATVEAAGIPTKALPIGNATPTMKPAKAATVKAAAPAPARAQQAAPAQQPAPAQAAPAAAPAPQPAQPTTFYDSVTPSSIPAGAQAAVYSDGTYSASPAQVAGHPNTLWIDTNGSNPKANALDVEPGDATPQQAATWVQQKLTATPNQTAIVYTYRAQWQATKDAISTLSPQMQSHVKWWIADPTGVPHIVPGSDATQWYWGQSYDQSLANPGF